MARRRHILRTRRGNFRWRSVELWILRKWLQELQPGQGWSQQQFIELCAALGRSPRSILEKARKLTAEPPFRMDVLERLPFTPSEIEDLNEELAIVGRSKDPSIKWDRRPRKKNRDKLRFNVVRRK